MGALIGPVFISASLWGGFNEEVSYRQDLASVQYKFNTKFHFQST